MASSWYLSKSKLMSGQQCAKRLWLEVNEPDELEHSASTERSFAIGHAVGDAAQSLYPDGILIEYDDGLEKPLKETERLLSKPGPLTLFEATFQADGVLIRADVLVRDESGEFQLIEVKAATSLKGQYSFDCAIQAWVLEQLGIRPRTIELAHINNQFVYGGDGNYDGLFTYEDVTEAAHKLQPKVQRLIAEMRAMLAENQPAIEMGRQCNDPYECPFIAHCTGPQSEYPIAGLSGSRAVKEQLIAEGFKDIREIPAGRLENETQEWVRRVTAAGQPDLRPEAAAELKVLGWPRYYFDFETVGLAVPIWKGTRPYQPQPFQWSCHVEREDGNMEHFEFLADTNEAPMRNCAQQLIAALGTEGPILVYTGYEKGVLTALSGLFPDLAPALARIIDRLFDLYPVTRRHYYHPDMHGSWSLKRVSPTIAEDLRYDNLDMVADGTAADAAYQDLISGDVPAAQRNAIRQALLDYCRLDTLALVKLAKRLGGEEQT